MGTVGDTFLETLMGTLLGTLLGKFLGTLADELSQVWRFLRCCTADSHTNDDPAKKITTRNFRHPTSLAHEVTNESEEVTLDS